MKCKHFERRATQVEPRTRLDDMLQLWRDVAVTVAGSDNCVSVNSAGKFAMQIVDDYAGYLLAIDEHRSANAKT
jgi:hypothetical protein